MVRSGGFILAVITIPMTIGAVGGIWLGIFVTNKAQVSPPVAIGVSLAMAIGMAVGFGETCKNWFDRNFGKKG